MSESDLNVRESVDSENNSEDEYFYSETDFEEAELELVDNPSIKISNEDKEINELNKKLYSFDQRFRKLIETLKKNTINAVTEIWNISEEYTQFFSTIKDKKFMIEGISIECINLPMIKMLTESIDQSMIKLDAILENELTTTKLQTNNFKILKNESGNPKDRKRNHTYINASEKQMEELMDYFNNNDIS